MRGPDDPRGAVNLERRKSLNTLRQMFTGGAVKSDHPQAAQFQPLPPQEQQEYIARHMEILQNKEGTGMGHTQSADGAIKYCRSFQCTPPPIMYPGYINCNLLFFYLPVYINFNLF